LFDVDCSSINDVKSALDKAKKGAAGQQLSKDLKDLLNADHANHTALKLALDGVQEGPVDCEIYYIVQKVLKKGVFLGLFLHSLSVQNTVQIDCTFFLNRVFC
jgi:hypothetical protein